MMRELDAPRGLQWRAADGGWRGMNGLVWGLLLWCVCVGAVPSAQAIPGAATSTVVALSSGWSASLAPGLSGRIHRFVSRTERAVKRLGLTLMHTASVWLAMIASALVCLVVVGCASVADRRMLDLRQHTPGAVVRDLVLGVRTFVRLLRDRRTPASARALVAAAVVYWMLPFDVLADPIRVYGVIDDLIAAVLAAKGFVALCPEAVIVANTIIGRR